MEYLRLTQQGLNSTANVRFRKKVLIKNLTIDFFKSSGNTNASDKFDMIMRFDGWGQTEFAQLFSLAGTNGIIANELRISSSGTVFNPPLFMHDLDIITGEITVNTDLSDASMRLEMIVGYEPLL